MNRIQFWVLTGLSSLVSLLWIAQIVVSILATSEQARVVAIQQAINEGNSEYKSGNALARRIYEVSQQKNDLALRDILTRSQITLPTGNQSEDNPAPVTPPAGIR